MAWTAAPVRAGAPVSLLGRAVSAISVAAPKWRPKLAAAVVTARRHVVTAAALATTDVGVFRLSGAAGLIVTGFSVLLLDFAVRG